MQNQAKTRLLRLAAMVLLAVMLADSLRQQGRQSTGKV